MNKQLNDVLMGLQCLIELTQLLEIVHEYLANSDKPELLLHKSVFLIGLYTQLSADCLTDIRLGLEGLIRKL